MRRGYCGGLGMERDWMTKRAYKSRVEGRVGGLVLKDFFLEA